MSPGRAGLCVLAVVPLVALLPADDGSAELAAIDRENVRITARLGTGQTGSFRMGGSLVDKGGVAAARRAVRGRLHTSMRLAGAHGTLALTSLRSCRSGRGTWKVVSGTGSYAGAAGGGAVSGPIDCTRPWKASTVVHAGAVVLPPPALAPAGAYGGWTPQDEYLEFEVAASGRAVVGLAVSGFSWDCVSQNGRFDLGTKRDRMPGPFPIADDRSFTVKLFENVTLTGRFSSGAAEGTITVAQYQFTDAYGKPATCGGTIPWTAATPPPPPRRALEGTYCGRTLAGRSACLDVLTGGREFRNLRVTVRLSCGNVAFELQLTLDETISLGPTLKFEFPYSQTIPGGEPATANLRGGFDQSGAMTGFLTLGRSSFLFEGARYTCTGGGASWTAQLQR